MMSEGKAMAKMQMTVESSGHVEISFTDAYTDERVTRRFSAPTAEGYVTEHMRGGRTGQVCEQLASTGSTLRASRETLADVIRREYRAMRRAEKALRSQW